MPREISKRVPVSAEKYAERFWSKVKKTRSCWIWTASTYWSHGLTYGHVYFYGRVRAAHRIAYIITYGFIPDGMDIDHLCRKTLCVNPKHLEPVPHRVNVIDRGQGPFAERARQTHCKYGHEFTPENTYIHKSRKVRVCRTCHRLRVNAEGKIKRANETPKQRAKRLAYFKALRSTQEYKDRFNAYRRERRQRLKDN